MNCLYMVLSHLQVHYYNMTLYLVTVATLRHGLYIKSDTFHVYSYYYFIASQSCMIGFINTAFHTKASV